MWLSTRFRFQEGDKGWADYLRFIGVPELKEVRSLDSALNEYVDDCGSCQVQSLDEIPKVLGSLPHPANERQYHLLFLDAENEKVPADVTGCRLLGHDLSDETHTSSLLNCGPWKRKLAAFIPRLNRYGLLSYDDAMMAKELLPSEWPGNPHAEVTVWALYQVAPPE